MAATFSRFLKRLAIWAMKHLIVPSRPGTEAFFIPAYAALGNFIMLSPMVKALREIFPSARIYILAGNRWGTEKVFQKGDGFVTDVIWMEETRATWKKVLFFLKLRSLRIGTAFLPFDAAPPFVWWGVLLAGIPRRVGHALNVATYDIPWRTKAILTDPVPLRTDAHETDIHFDLLDKITGTPIRRHYDTIVASAGESALAKFGLKSRAYVVIQILAARGRETAKIWPRERFAALIQKLENDGFMVILPGNERERPIVSQFVDEYNIKASNVAGQTSIAEISAILEHASLVICHDSGLMHIANAHGTPLIALYGPTDEGFTAPKGPASRILRRSLACAPCMKNMAKTEVEALRDCPVNIRCMREISVDEVYQACQEALRLGK